MRVILPGVVLAMMGVLPGWGATQPADLVLTDARIYTSTTPEFASALAVRGDRIVFVGSVADAKAFVGPKTRVERAHGRLVIPGLVDAHLHPADIVDLDVCDLDSKPMPLRALSAFVRACLDRYHTAPGKRLLVHQWNYTDGNQTDPQYPTLRAALDQASTQHEIQLLGDDAHHGAFNSLALAHAKNSHGAPVGISKATLSGE
jgi:predicted amidohydrolase YtcJ